jgi:cytochrome P450
MDNPDQLEKFYDNPELIENAVEEIIRYATPVLHFRRTATKHTEIDGHPIAAGDKVVMWYASSNFDEEFFENPFRPVYSEAPHKHYLARNKNE